MDYTVTPVRTIEDEKIFIAFLNKYLYFRNKDGANKFKWFYKDAPIPGETFLLRTEDGVPVGTKGYGFHEFTLNGKIIRGAISVDICTDEKHRGLKPALFLNKKSMEMLETPVDFHYTIPNNNSDALFKRRASGFKKIGQFQRCVKILNTKPALETRLTNKFVLNTAYTISNPLWYGVNWVRSSTYKRFDVCDELDDSLLETLHQQNVNTSSLVGIKNLTYLNWRTSQYPFTNYKVLTFLGKGSIVYHIKEGRAHISNIIFSMTEYEESLISILLNFEAYCANKRLTSIVIPFIGDSRFVNLLKKLWYMKYQPGYNLWVSSSLDISPTNCLMFTGDIDSE